MTKYKEHPFNEYLSKHYNYKPSEEEEIRTQIYKNKETTEFTSMITILKSVWFKVKAEVKTVVIEGNIYLEVTVRYFQKVAPEDIKQLIQDLRKQLTKDNIIVKAKELPEESFNNLRVIEL